VLPGQETDHSGRNAGDALSTTSRGASLEADGAEGARVANEWTVTVSRDDFERLPRLGECEATCLQVGDWPEATVYFQGCDADEARHTLILRFTDRP
jgi:hypothetical protein